MKIEDNEKKLKELKQNNEEVEKKLKIVEMEKH